MRKTIHEVFDEVSKETDKQKKIELLRKNESVQLKYLLQLGFDAVQQFDLPEGSPPYKTDTKVPIGMSDTNLFVETRRIYVFLKDKDLPKVKKEQLFIQMLEGLHHTEAELLIAVKDKKLSERYAGLTADLVKETFPNLLHETVAEPAVKRGRGRPRKNVEYSPT